MLGKGCKVRLLTRTRGSAPVGQWEPYSQYESGLGTSCLSTPAWIRTTHIWVWVVWQVCLLSHCGCMPILNVLMSRSAIKGSPLGSVMWERRHTLPHTHTHTCTDLPPPIPALGSVRICYSLLYFTLFDLEFWSLFLSAFFLSFFFFFFDLVVSQIVLIHKVSRWCAPCKLGTVALLVLMLSVITYLLWIT